MVFAQFGGFDFGGGGGFSLEYLCKEPHRMENRTRTE